MGLREQFSIPSKTFSLAGYSASTPLLICNLPLLHPWKDHFQFVKVSLQASLEVPHGISFVKVKRFLVTQEKSEASKLENPPMTLDTGNEHKAFLFLLVQKRQSRSLKDLYQPREKLCIEKSHPSRRPS